MSHSITAKLNQAAREHAGQNGVTFFVSLGEKNYDFKTKQNVWTNYDAALFAKDAQIEFYRSALVENAIVEVSGTGIIVDDADKQYKPKLMIQDAKLGFVHNQQGAPQQANAGFQQQAPQQQSGFQQQTAPQQGGFANNQQQAPRDANGFTQAQGGFQQQAAQQQAPHYPQDNTPPF